MHMSFVPFCDFFMGAQVISWPEAHSHLVLMFVPYFSAENLAILPKYNVIVFKFMFQFIIHFDYFFLCYLE